MSAFAIEHGACGSGPARYEDGLFTLPDTSTCGIEAVLRLDVGADDTGPSLQRSTSTLAASLRDTLDSRRRDAPLPLPWRLALSTMQAGLGVIEEGLRTGSDIPVVITFVDGDILTTSMARDLAELIRRDAGIVHAAIDRAGAMPGHRPVEAPVTPEDAQDDTTTEAALTSIFRYEKRNGRLRRVPITDPEA